MLHRNIDWTAMPRPSSATLRRPIRRPVTADPFVEVSAPFANPGGLRMLAFVPDGLPASAPLVVVLHGCTQTAGGYDLAAGWSVLAKTHGFALLYPEQTRANNANGCFNWFEVVDTRRGSGEVASIAAAVTAMVAKHKLDRSRIFVTGLSAGGAMANACLAAYPDLFAGGAIIAGLPVGAASGMGEAFAAMSNPAALSTSALGDKVRTASTFVGPWPVVTVWHGSADSTVSRANGVATAGQWADVHGATAARDGDRTVWRNAAGVAVVEFVEIDGMGHGTPIDSRNGGTPAPFMLDVGIASSAQIIAFWGIGDPVARTQQPTPPPPDAPHTGRHNGSRRIDIGKVISDALRAAGIHLHGSVDGNTVTAGVR
jgi:poly(hydroxyalkanoate) depolymerase family esterase